MADRPPYCVAYTDEDEVIRIEYYEGHDELTQVYDLRRYDLYNKELLPDMKEDLHKMDVSNNPDFSKIFNNKLGYFLQSLFEETHLSVIKRSGNSKLRYYGRCSETLRQHQERLRFAVEKSLA